MGSSQDTPETGNRRARAAIGAPAEPAFTDWTPLSTRSPLFPDDIDESDPWQFRNVLVH